MKTLCICNSNIKEKTEDVLVTFTALDRSVVVASELIVAINASHVPIV